MANRLETKKRDGSNLAIERVSISEKELDEIVLNIIARRSTWEKIFGRYRRLSNLLHWFNHFRPEVTNEELVDSLLRLWETKKIRIMTPLDKSSNVILEALS